MANTPGDRRRSADSIERAVAHLGRACMAAREEEYRRRPGMKSPGQCAAPIASAAAPADRCSCLASQANQSNMDNGR